MTGFKTADSAGGFRVRLAIGALMVALAVGAFAAGRLTAPDGETAGARSPVPSAPLGIVYTRDGVPTGFPATRHGAGDAGAWFETLISAAAVHGQVEMRALLVKLVDPSAQPGLVDALMPSTVREGNLNIVQTTVLRVWAEPEPPGDLPVGMVVKVKTLALGLFGARTDGRISAPTTGLAGGADVHDLTMVLTVDGWRLRDVATPVPVPPPDLAGSRRDGGERNTQGLAEVLGPDSWVPNMP